MAKSKAQEEDGSSENWQLDTGGFEKPGLHWRAALTEGAKEAKFLCSHFARFRTTTTRRLRIPAARIRRDTFAYPDGAEPINDSQ
jgi:hypothetical protein